MKYLKRTNQYKASNFRLDMNTMTAWSYDWWQLLFPVGDKLVLNTYKYSPTTQRHISKLRHLLDALGIITDFEVNLNYHELSKDPDRLIDILNLDNFHLYQQLAKELNTKRYSKKRTQKIESIGKQHNENNRLIQYLDELNKGKNLIKEYYNRKERV